MSKMKQLAAEATPCVAESSSVCEFTSDVTSDLTSDVTSEASASEIAASEVSTLTTQRNKLLWYQQDKNAASVTVRQRYADEGFLN